MNLRLALLCASILCYGFPAVTGTACSIEGEHCELQAPDDTFVALQVHQVVTSGNQRKDDPSPLIPDQSPLMPKVYGAMSDGWKGVQLVDAGLSRTGTESIEVALKSLGYTCSHGERFKMPHTPENAAIKQAGHGGDPAPFLDYLEQGAVGAVMDSPLNMFVRLFEKKYNAKVLLSLHPGGKSGWVKSMIKFVRWWPIGSAYKTPPQWEVLPGCIVPVAPNATLSDSMRRTCEQAYEDHNNLIIANVPKESLIVYTVTSGWDPLCKFLGKPVPNVDGEKPAFPWIDGVKTRKNLVAKCGDLSCVHFVNGHSPRPGDEKLIPKSDG